MFVDNIMNIPSILWVNLKRKHKSTLSYSTCKYTPVMRCQYYYRKTYLNNYNMFNT